MSCGKCGTDPVSPQAGKQKDEHSHIERFDQSVPEYGVCHIAESACSQIDSFFDGDVVDFHAVCHGIRHDDPENDSLKFGFRHFSLSFQDLMTAGSKDCAFSVYGLLSLFAV